MLTPQASLNWKSVRLLAALLSEDSSLMLWNCLFSTESCPLAQLVLSWYASSRTLSSGSGYRSICIAEGCCPGELEILFVKSCHLRLSLSTLRFSLSSSLFSLPLAHLLLVSLFLSLSVALTVNGF